MSLLEELSFDHDFSPCGSKRTSSSLACVNPQYTDKRYGAMPLGFMTPEPSPTEATPRRESFNGGTYYSGSSESSFSSHSGYGTPSQLTPGSSTSDSLGHSMMLLQDPWYLSATSSSPSLRPQGRNKAANTEQYAVQPASHGSYSASTDTASSISPAACTPGDDLATVVDGYARKVSRPWQSCGPQNDTLSLRDRTAQPTQINESAMFGPDLVSVYGSIADGGSHTFESSQPLFAHAQPMVFDPRTSQLDTAAYDAAGNSGPNPPSLAPAMVWGPQEYDTDMGLAGDDMMSTAATVGQSYHGDIFARQPLKDSSHHLETRWSPSSRIATLSPASDHDAEGGPEAPSILRTRNRRHRQGQRAAVACRQLDNVIRGGPRREHLIQIPKPEVVSRGKPHRCWRDGCTYACNRPEHLKRHELSGKHMNDGAEMLPCAFDGCIDRKTGKHRKIISRFDNLKAHYTKTHFKYGSTEKGGKNERKSMKAAHQMGLNAYDSRWAMLLDGKMNVNREIKDYLHVWKMLGYSILETRDTKVKDLVPDWQQGPEDATLQKYDPRWRALWDGTLTFDKAMDVGRDMNESDAQGLLGVTMLETKAMGIDHLDPRWEAMLSGRMSVEQLEKLGVKHVWKDLVAKRRAR